jgi:AAA domain
LGQQCEQGDVLALMLEDTDRRLQRRLTKMLGAQKEEWPKRLTYATGWPRLNDDGLDWMREWIGRASKPRLIIIDILERIRQRISSKDKASQYSADYDALAALQELSAEAQLSILVLHHQRKLGADDLIDTLSGTLGLGGAVDAVLILGKDQQFGKYLYGRGRDLEEFGISIQQDAQCRWQVLGPRTGEQASPERANIIAVLAKAGRPMNVKDISEAIGGKTENVKNLLKKLHSEGQVERVSWGWYQLPKDQKDIPF